MGVQTEPRSINIRYAARRFTSAVFVTDNLYCGKQVVIMMTAFLVKHGENKKGRKYSERFNYNEVAWKRNQKVSSKSSKA